MRIAQSLHFPNHLDQILNYQPKYDNYDQCDISYIFHAIHLNHPPLSEHFDSAQKEQDRLSHCEKLDGDG